MSLKVGDWVTSYSCGIWQVYRIIHYNDIDPVTAARITRTAVFSKRFVNNSFKKSFSEECCEQVLVKPLGKDITLKLDEYIRANKEIYDKFRAHSPREIDAVYNARIGIPGTMKPGDVMKKISREKAFTIKEIIPYLNGLGFNTDEMPSWTVQFVSRNHELVDDWLAYRFEKILEY